MCSRCGAAFFATETDPVSVYHNVVSCRARIFTVDSRDAFVGYLDEIERSAPAGHQQLVEAVYGENYLQPFWELYEWRDR